MKRLAFGKKYLNRKEYEMKWFENIDYKEILKIENWSIEFIISLSIITTIILYLPENINTNINETINKYNDLILFVNVLSWFLLIVVIINFMINKIKEIQTKKMMINDILNLTDEEHSILKAILNDKDLTIIADMNSGTIYNLNQKGYIYMTGNQYATSVGDFGEIYIKFTINPKLRNFIKENKSLKNKFSNNNK